LCEKNWAYVVGNREDREEPFKNPVNTAGLRIPVFFKNGRTREDREDNLPVSF
jgi:hypothetical protein